MAANPARNAPPPAPEVGAAPKKRSHWKVLLLVLGVLLVAGGAGGWYWWQSQNVAQLGKTGPHRVAVKPAAYLPLKLFTVNLQNGGGEQYLQVGLTLRLEGHAYAKAIKAHMPDIRNRILLLLSSKSAAQIDTVQGKKKLSDQIGQQVLAALDGGLPPHTLSGVLFTSFVIQ